LLEFRNSKPTKSIRREYQGISLAISTTNMATMPYDCMPLYGLSHHRHTYGNDGGTTGFRVE